MPNFKNKASSMPKNKLALLFLLLLALPNIASAQTFLIDYFPVIVYGDTESYRKIFNGVAIIFNNKSVTDFLSNVIGSLDF